MTQEELLKQALRESQAVTDASIENADAQSEQQTLNDIEAENLATTQQTEQAALQDYNKQSFDNLGTIIDKIETTRGRKKLEDENMRKRENAYRYISGVGDTLSSFANLIGTAHGASNQQQVYNSNVIAQKAEAERKARKLEMDDLDKRLEEMQSRQRDLKAAGSLKEAEMKARHDRERYKLTREQADRDEANKRYYDEREYRAMRDTRADMERERTFNEQRNQWNKTYKMQLAKFKQELADNNYNFVFSDGAVSIPKNRINDANVERIYQMIPEEVRNTIKGEAFTDYETDEIGNTIRKTGHKAPTINQKLAAIGAYAESNPSMKKEIEKLASADLPEELKEFSL